MRAISRASTLTHVNEAARARCWARMNDIDLQHATERALADETLFNKRRLASRFLRVLAHLVQPAERDVDQAAHDMFDRHAARLGKRGGAA